MKIKRLIIIITISLIGIFIFRNALLRIVTKNWEKEYLVYETNEFKVEMAINLEKGCVKRGIDFQKDTILISNLKLTDILLILTHKNINNSHFAGFGKNRKEGYDFSYYPKDSTGNYKIHVGEILDKLGQEFNFTYKFDTIEKTIYNPQIYDYERLKKHATSDNSGRFQMGKNYIKCSGANLGGIFASFSGQIKDLIVENSIKDSSFYEFNIPSINKDEIISYVNDDFGIKLIEKKAPIEMLTIQFE